MNFRASLPWALAALTFSSVAAAQQPWLEDRRYGEGIGLRAGDLELHPGIAGEFGYDSNYFQRSPEEGPVRFLRLRITPHLFLSTLGAKRREVGGIGAPPSATFRAGVAASYNEFFALKSEESEVASDQRHLDARANFDLDVLPERPWGIDVNGDFIRTVEPSNSGVEDSAFDRDTLRLGAGVNWRPGGGLFEWRLGYEFRYNIFERSLFQEFNNTQHFLQTRGRWRFFPRTALLYDAEYGIISYSENRTQNDGELIQARLGINGLVTTRFSLLVLGGWTQSYYGSEAGIPPRNYDDFVAHVEAKYFVMPQPRLEPTSAAVGLSSIAVGYVRNFQDSYYGDFYRRDRGYLDFEYFIGGAFLLSAEAGLSRLTYPDVFSPGSATAIQPSFGETRADVELFGEYRFSDVFAVNSTLRYDGNLSDQTVVTNIGDRTQDDRLRFNRYQAWLGARLFW
jgi:hypothetical protein